MEFSQFNLIVRILILSDYFGWKVFRPNLLPSWKNNLELKNLPNLDFNQTFLLITVHAAEREEGKLICDLWTIDSPGELWRVTSIDRELSHCAQYLHKIFLAKIPTNPHIEASS